MKNIFLALFLLFAIQSFAQRQTQNLIIVTTDGLRWQEVFKGMDSSIANKKKFHHDDSAYIFKQYWASTEIERREKLLPFFWKELVPLGQVYGNRDLKSDMNVANPYWFSYPGYSEIFSGYADTAVNSNEYPPNPNITVLEFLNKQSSLKGKISAFGAWDAFDRILNKQRSGLPVVAAFENTGGKTPTAAERLINAMNKDSYKPFGEEECLDVFTHYAALENLKNKKPRILYIAYGETDEWAHAGNYKSYLDAAHQVDKWLAELWNFIQSDPQYKGKTTLLFTVDHGRGEADKWTSHNNKIPGADEIWFAAIGPDTPAMGEAKDSKQLFQEQIAQTIAKLMGYTFTVNHPVAEEIKSIIKIK